MTDTGRLWAALQEHSDGRVSGLTKLDENVYRVDRGGDSAWVARLFDRPVLEVQADALILRNLEQAGFPAERVATTDAVVDFEGGSVLLTAFVAGERAPGDGHSYAVLGELLGRLHGRSGESVRAGGAWHTLISGGPAEELAAAEALLGGISVDGQDSTMLAIVRDELGALDDCAGLPESFVHADFVPSNAIVAPNEKLVIIDWAGAGRGPRLWSVGWLLWTAGARSAKLVDVVLSRYLRRIEFTIEELERLDGVLGARAVTIACWELAHGRKSLLETVEAVDFAGQVAARTAAQVREFAQVRGRKPPSRRAFGGDL